MHKKGEKAAFVLMGKYMKLSLFENKPQLFYAIAYLPLMPVTNCNSWARVFNDYGWRIEFPTDDESHSFHH